MAESDKPLLIKRYASRRLYNTETSDYVTLEDIAGFIRGGREVQIVDLKTGDDLTRQYLLQIIAEHESRGESILPVAVLNDLVRSYASQATSVVPQFLQTSFDMLRDGQSKVMENMGAMNPMAKMPGFEAMQAQQEAFMKAMSGTWGAPGVQGARAMSLMRHRRRAKRLRHRQTIKMMKGLTRSSNSWRTFRRSSPSSASKARHGR
nr:polyhydroxyalkanoate synthesis repressor PhaR [Aquicoccus sp. G2-2]MEA1112712.1 polyhydroxyalkanoate synthesis repressor PhaR [Aquicoccus sp. G2-2]